MKLTFASTKKACYLGYITQAIVNNLAPLLFMTFQKQFDISTGQFAFLISLNFAIQMVVDLLASLWVDKIGWRKCAVFAHVMAGLGLIGLGVFPNIFPTAFAGLLTAIIINAIGGGIIEVLISPIVEAIPSDKKAAEMSFLHSFYCWGHVGVVLLSTLFFVTVGRDKWHILAVIWAVLPLANALLFSKVPFGSLVQEHEETVPLKKLFSRKLFFLVIILMICSGAAEQAISQWSSFFAEAGLGVDKTTGDLLGTCLFAVLMGASRLIYGFYGHKLNLERALQFSSALCVASYLIVVFAPWPLVSLLGCGLAGFSVGLMWPGVTSIASKHFRKGGTAMFAMLALAGDIGCSAGPGLVGAVSGFVESSDAKKFLGFFGSDNIKLIGLKLGVLVAIAFAIVLFLGITSLKLNSKKKGSI